MIRCKKCGKRKRDNQFYASRISANGKTGTCISCHTENVKAKQKSAKICDGVDIRDGWIYNKRTGEVKPVPKIDMAKVKEKPKSDRARRLYLPTEAVLDAIGRMQQ